MAKLQNVNDATFAAEVVNTSGPVLVDFSATWCGPCRQLAPTLEALAGEYAGKVKFVAVDIDEARATAMKFNVMSVPTMILFKDGGVVGQMVGNRPKHDIAALLDQAVAP